MYDRTLALLQDVLVHMFELLKYGVSAVAHLNADVMVNQLLSSFILHPYAVSRTRPWDQEVPQPNECRIRKEVNPWLLQTVDQVSEVLIFIGVKLILAHHYTIEPVSSLAFFRMLSRLFCQEVTSTMCARKEDTEDNIRKGRWTKIIHIESVIQTSMISRNDFCIFLVILTSDMCCSNSAHRGLCADWLHRCLDGCLRPEGDTWSGYRGGQPLWIAVDFGCGQAEMEKKMQGLAPEDIFFIRDAFHEQGSHVLGFKLGHLLGCHEACWAGWEMWEIHGNLASARHFCFSVMELLICAPFISILLHAQIIHCLQVKERTTPLTSPFVQLAQYFRSVHNHVITYSSTFFCQPFSLRPTALPAQWSIVIRVE